MPRRHSPNGLNGRARGGDEHALRLEVHVERLEAELAAEAGLLVAAERDPREGGVGRVDADLAGLDPARERSARDESRVQTLANSPYFESFAIRIASFSSSKRITVATGPKISSCATSMRLSTFASTVGG